MDAIQKHETLPYLHNRYNIESFFQGQLSLVKPAVARFINSLLDVLNHPTQLHLPKYVILFPDKDIIKDLKDEEYGAKKLIKSQLQWLIVQINSLLETRRKELQGKRIGSISSDPTKIIFPNN